MFRAMRSLFGATTGVSRKRSFGGERSENNNTDGSGVDNNVGGIYSVEDVFEGSDVLGDMPNIKLTRLASRRDSMDQRMRRESLESSSPPPAGYLSQKRQSIPGELVNKRVSIAKDVEMPMRKPKTVYENMLDWSMVTNIHGTYYVFEQDVYTWSKIFWGIVWLCLFGFSLYMISIAYIGWCDNPVLTTVSTTALPVRDIEFPVITICGLGTIKETVQIAFLNQVIRYLGSKKGININSNNINKTTTAEELLTEYDTNGDFMSEFYPGATLSPLEMVAAMTSQNPNERIRAEIVVSGGYDRCKDKSMSNDTKDEKEEDSYNICNNLLYDRKTEMCYAYSSRITELEDAYHGCWNKLGSLFYPFSDSQLLGLIGMIENGPLSVLKNGGHIWVDLTRSSDGSYKLLDGQKLVNDTFRYLNLTNTNIDDPRQRCFVMHYSRDLRMFIGKQAFCRHYYPSLCYSQLQAEPNCTAMEEEKKMEMEANVGESNLVDRLLNPNTRLDLNKDVARKKKKFYRAFRSLDVLAAYPNLFELLWYSQLPCFDVNGYFDFPYQRSLLKQCWWKGVNMPCAAIFKTVPTDRGMCCTFNMKEADDIFLESNYRTMVSELQRLDRNNSFAYPGLPDWYTNGNEPHSEHGIKRGLSITLDAHTDLIGSSTVSEDFQGFIAMVSSRNGYPLTNQDSIRIRPGHDTLVAMSATDVQADLEYMEVKDRKCYYPNGKTEDELMVMHKTYSQAGCVLECQILYAMDKMREVGEEPCVPWYLPTLNNNTKMCNPWSAVAFREQIDLIPSDQCGYCLPDCQSTTYRQTSTTTPFRTCDNANLGISNFCNLDDTTLPDPPIFGKQVLKEFEGLPDLPDYVKSIQSNERSKSDVVFKKSSAGVKYDAYEKDIAVVHFYFETPTVFQYSRQPRMSWIDFVSQVGGLLGLCLGFSICMGVEVLYWTLCRIWFDLKTNQE